MVYILNIDSRYAIVVVKCNLPVVLKFYNTDVVLHTISVIHNDIQVHARISAHEPVYSDTTNEGRMFRGFDEYGRVHDDDVADDYSDAGDAHVHDDVGLVRARVDDDDFRPVGAHGDDDHDLDYDRDSIGVMMRVRNDDDDADADENADDLLKGVKNYQDNDDCARDSCYADVERSVVNVLVHGFGRYSDELCVLEVVRTHRYRLESLN